MKKIFLIIFLFICANISYAQNSNIISKTITVSDSLRLKNKWISGISDDTLFSDAKYFILPTQKAVKTYVDNSIKISFDGKLNISDTSNMLLNYLKKIDTVNLSNRINLKENIISNGSINQYFSWDKTWKDLNVNAVIGLQDSLNKRWDSTKIKNYSINQVNVNTVDNLIELTNYSGKATTIFVKDTLRGGIFHLQTTAAKIDSGIVFPATALGAGNYWVRNWDKAVVDVKWYGAKGDGVTDDSYAVQKAINSFQKGGNIGNGISILFSKGTYLIHDIIVKTGTKIFANQTIAKDNFIANVPVTIKPFGHPNYIFYLPDTVSNITIENLYIEGDWQNQSQLLAAVRLGGQKIYLIGNNINNCAQIAVLNNSGLCYIEKNGIYGWYGSAPTFTGTNDFRGALHIPAMGDSYVYDNEIGAGLSYFTSTVSPRDPVNGRICAMYLGSVFGGTSVISGNLFENGDRSVVIGNSLYCTFHNNRYELSAMGGLYIYGPMQFATFIGERFADNSLSSNGAYDDITIGIGSAGNISFISPIFERLVNEFIPNSSFKSKWNISNFGSALIDLTTPQIDTSYALKGLINNEDVSSLPVRQVTGQYAPTKPIFTSVSTEKLISESNQVGYAKLVQGTDSDTKFCGAIEFWDYDRTLRGSIGFAPGNDLYFNLNKPNGVFAFGGGSVAINKNGESKLTIWSLDGTNDSKIILQGKSDISNQSIFKLNNSTGNLEISSSGSIIFGSNQNLLLQSNGLSFIPFAPNAGTTSNSYLLARNSTTGEINIINPATFLNITNTVAAKTVLIGPTSGAATTPSFRLLDPVDIPNLDGSKITSGTISGTLLGSGSNNYIRNGNTSQIANFFITGTGRIEGPLSINVGNFPSYALQVSALSTSSGIAAQFIGRVIASDAVNANELVTRSQLEAATGGGINFPTGKSIQSGDGTTTTFLIPHSLGGTPVYVYAESGSSDASGIKYRTADATNIIIVYDIAPPAGTNNLIFYWSTKL